MLFVALFENFETPELKLTEPLVSLRIISKQHGDWALFLSSCGESLWTDLWAYHSHPTTSQVITLALEAVPGHRPSLSYSPLVDHVIIHPSTNC